jgi:hypothetical protein
MAITKTSAPNTLKIWSLLDYSMLYSLSPDDAENSVEVRFGEQLIMLISRKESLEVNFRIINPFTREMLRNINVKYDPSIKLSCIEFFSSSLIFK